MCKFWSKFEEPFITSCFNWKLFLKDYILRTIYSLQVILIGNYFEKVTYSRPYIHHKLFELEILLKSLHTRDIIFITTRSARGCQGRGFVVRCTQLWHRMCKTRRSSKKLLYAASRLIRAHCLARGF